MTWAVSSLTWAAARISIDTDEGLVRGGVLAITGSGESPPVYFALGALGGSATAILAMCVYCLANRQEQAIARTVHAAALISCAAILIRFGLPDFGPGDLLVPISFLTVALVFIGRFLAIDMTDTRKAHGFPLVLVAGGAAVELATMCIGLLVLLGIAIPDILFPRAAIYPTAVALTEIGFIVAALAERR